MSRTRRFDGTGRWATRCRAGAKLTRSLPYASGNVSRDAHHNANRDAKRSNVEGIAMHAILGFITVGSVGVSSLFLALAAISDGLGDLS